MTCVDALGKRLAQRFDRVAQMEGSKRGRDLKRTFSNSIDGVAPCAFGQRESLAALLGRRYGQRRTHHEERETNLVQMNLHWQSSILASVFDGAKLHFPYSNHCLSILICIKGPL